MPTYNGIDGCCYDWGTGISSDHADSYVNEYHNEALEIEYSDGRILTFRYIAPLDVTEELNSNVALMEFDDALELIYDQLALNFSSTVMSGMRPGVNGNPDYTITKKACI